MIFVRLQISIFALLLWLKCRVLGVWILFCSFGCRKGDYFRYLAEFKTGNEKKEAADQSLKAYEVCAVCRDYGLV